MSLGCGYLITIILALVLGISLAQAEFIRAAGYVVCMSIIWTASDDLRKALVDEREIEEEE